MTISPVTINNNLGTDRATAKAIHFVNADDKAISRLAKRNYNREHGQSDKNFAKVTNAAFKSIPLVAFASGLVLGKGLKASAKRGAFWGLMFAAPAVVYGADKAIKSHSENKNAGMSTGTKVLLSLGGFFAGNALLNKVSANKKVNEVADKLIDGARDKFGKLTDSVKMPEFVSGKFTKAKEAVSSKVKVPEFAKETIEKAKNLEFLGKVANKALEVGKKTLEHSPDILLWGTLAATILKGVSVANKISHEKAQIKDAQFNTAKDLANKFGEENLASKTIQE